MISLEGEAEQYRPAHRDIVIRKRRYSRAQRDLWRAKKRFVLFRGGRGSGKTYAGTIWAATRPAGSVVMVAAPTYKSLKSAALMQLLPLLQELGLVKRNGYRAQDGEIHCIDGKLFLLRSLDRYDVSTRGPNLSHLWLDEGRDVRTMDPWLSLMASLRVGEEQQAIITTTPSKNWLWEFFERDKRKPDRMQIVSRVEDNPAAGQSFIESLRNNFNEGYARQELDGEWVDLGGVEVYDPTKLLSAPLPPNKLVRTVRAWDTAATGGDGDYSVGILLSIDSQNRLYIRDIVRGQWAPHERDRIIRSTAEGDDAACGLTAIFLARERAGAGTSQVAYWTRLLVGFRVSTDVESGDKVVRAGPAATQMNNGNMTLTNEPGRWSNYWDDGTRLVPVEAQRKFIEHIGLFPKARYDDEADALASAVKCVSKVRDLGVY